MYGTPAEGEETSHPTPSHIPFPVHLFYLAVSELHPL